MSKQEEIEKRAEATAYFIINTKCTIRQCASHFKCSKSTVFKDLTKILPNTNLTLYNKVRDILNYNKNIRNIRCGNSTKKMYENKNKLKKEEIKNYEM